MPELPEVETVVRALRAPLVGREFSGLESEWPRHIATPSLEEMRHRLLGQRILGLSRRGKYILLYLSGEDTLIIHLRMSGHLAVVAAETPRHKHDHTVFSLAPIPDGGGQREELRFRDQRKFGRIYLVSEPNEILGKLGPEPLGHEFTATWFHMSLQSRSRVIKTLLLDQHFVAGIGNIYADEALFRAGIYPRRKSDTISTAESGALHNAIRQVLQIGIEREGASIDLYRKPDGSKGDMQNAVAVYGRTGEPCQRCGTPIERIALNNRGTHFCPSCQK